MSAASGQELPRNAERRPWRLLALGLAFAAAALFYEFLWLARMPSSEFPEGGMGFAVRRAGLEVRLSPRGWVVFAVGSAALGACAVGVALVGTRRVLAPADRARPGGGHRWVLGGAAVVLLVFALPLRFAIGWADGVVYPLALYDAPWARRECLRALGLATAGQFLWLSALVALVGAGSLVRCWPCRVGEAVVRAVRRVPPWAIALAAGVALACGAAVYAKAVLGGEPSYPDAAIYHFQAKTLASGRLTSPLLGAREFFDPSACPFPSGTPFAFAEGRWFGVGLPFAPLCYAAGVAAGVPWVVGPLLGGAVVLAAYFLAREVFGRGAAAPAAALAAVSPWLVLMSAEYLTHVPGALVGTLFVVAALRAMDRSSWRAALVAGLCLGLLAATRPVTAVGLCAPTAVAWVVWLARRRGEAWRPTVAFAAALAVPLAGILAYNAGTTGSPTTFGYQLAVEDWQMLPPSLLREGWEWRPALGLANLAQMLRGLDRGSMRWPVPWLGAALGALILWGPPRATRRRAWVLVLALTPLSLALAYVRWSRAPEGLGGPRYVFEALPVAVVLGAGALVTVRERLLAGGAGAERASAVLLLGLGFCAVYGVAGTAVWELPRYRAAAKENAAMFEAMERQAEPPAVVFFPVGESDRHTAKFYLLVGRNDPGLSGPIVYARDLGPRNRLLAKELPDRNYYRWDHDRSALVPIEADETSAGEDHE
ncbi:MAG: glycosyltransferase family 39 protein [Candidatus Brocadiia bacterium]